ncbi:hypothetical protein [Sphingosinicella rhizophila]|uniref:Phage shock protein B n=1 Tax=Sphingosinicella rhizophila TaxID=3050082 RepID=A0ABU3Q2A9_9SPHN|nr:hypothetical protein [Sphingosinicella sp. GR2756]MDT9597555.1 hypothetical protein [Sphingosinicella sp. GR2756]
MTDPSFFAILSAGFLALALVSAAGLRAWRDWLSLKRLEIASHSHQTPSSASRIDLADLKERVGKLEAIASGDDV